MHAIAPFRITVPALTALIAAIFVPTAQAVAAAPDFRLCQAAAQQAESAARIPDEFLAAIARVESGRVDPSSGALVAWPWTIDVGGSGTFFDSKEQAIAAVKALQARGVTSIDVGCLQVNLALHPDAFASLEQAFDPATNARFAAGFLRSLFAQTGSWPLAAAAYHSQTPTLGAAYQQRVLAAWAVPEGASARSDRGASAAVPRPAAAAPGPAFQAASVAGGAAFGRTAITPGHAQSAVAAPMAWPATGRGLAAYRAMPTRLAFAPARHPAS
jgi:hypothetical protein